MSRWGRTTFPPMNWEVIGAKVGDNAFENLFYLIDYLQCHSSSAADTERV